MRMLRAEVPEVSVVLAVLVLLVLVGVRHPGDVQRRSMTYAATAAGAEPRG
ncbi:hypothetical protein [Streptomyces sp. NPDC020480]|uniref:hypothetical protein n=1 Tax=Streptomyces sp. NPDC020480 TaxID=3365076 RepID=UPI0037A3C67E